MAGGTTDRSSAKVQKTLVRQRERIAAGDFYEAHQQLRTISSRYVKAQEWEAALAINHEGALALLQANQGGSGGDLACSYVGILQESKTPETTPIQVKLLAILRAFSSQEPTRKAFVSKIVAWSAAVGIFPNGHPDLHHAIGSMYAQEAESMDAERHLALGTRESAEALATYEYEWYLEDDSHTAATYAARCVLPYILTGNLRAAGSAYDLFTSKLCGSTAAPMRQEIQSKSLQQQVFPSLPLLNFLSLLLLAAHRGSADLYRQLGRHYKPYLEEVPSWNDSLAHIGETYFGIRSSKQSNPLFDMMGSMMGFGAPTPKPRLSKIEASNAAPPSEGLD